MNELTKQSISDLTRRLRVAGDEYHDLRVTIWHGIDLPLRNVRSEYSGTFGVGSSRGSDGTWWKRIYHFQDQLSPTRSLPGFRNAEFAKLEKQWNEKSRPILERARSLFGDADWLASEVGFDQFPGVEGFDPTGFSSGQSRWLLLLFHAAWTRPKGSLLRATRLQAEDHAAEERFFSTLPIDPFTASAALLELMVQGNGEPDDDLTRLMSKQEAANLHYGGKIENPTDYFKKLIAKGLITEPIGSGQKWRFKKSDFPQDAETQRKIS